MSDILDKTRQAALAGGAPPTAEVDILQQKITEAGGDQIAPVTGEVDFQDTNLRNEARARMTDQSYQQQIDDRSRAVDFFVKLNPELSRDQVTDRLPQLYEALTGKKHNDSRSLVDGIGDAWDRFWKSVESEDTFRNNDRIQGGTDTTQGLLQLLFPTSGTAQVLKEEIKTAAAGEDVKARRKVQVLDEAVSKTAVSEGGQWWLGAVDNSTQLVGSLTYVGREAAAGALVGNGTGAAVAGWNASARMMSNSSYRTMRERGVDRDIADATANVIGYSAASVEMLGLGGAAKVVLTPLVKKAIMASIPSVARAVAAGGLKAGAATAIGTAEEVIQEGVSIAGENEAYKAQNTRQVGDKMARAWEASQLAGDQVEASVLAVLEDYNKTALVPLDNPADIARRLKDTAINSAMGMAILGGLGGIGGTVADLRTIKEWDKAGVLREKAAEVARDVKTEKAIAAAEPQPGAQVTTAVMDDSGEAVTVYHPADQALAAGRGSLSNYGNGVLFFTDREMAEQEARAMSTGPLSAEGLVTALKRQYPDTLVQAVQAVIQGGRVAEAPFVEELTAWNQDNPTMDYAQILDLAESIHDGSTLADRNDIVRNYGLESALPAGGIVEAKIRADKVARVDSELEVAKAFKEGAEAVEFDGTWYVKDADRVVVTAKTESRAESATKTPVGRMSYQANENTIRALTEDGKEAGRVQVSTEGDKVMVRGLTTGESYRRQGVARALVTRIMEQNPGKTIDWGNVKTEEGRAFQEAVRRSLPTWQQWGQRVARAEAEGNTQKAEFYRQKADTVPSPADVGPGGSALTLDQLRTVLSKGMTHDEADAALAIMGRMAWSAGTTLDDLLKRAVESVEWVSEVRDGAGQVRQGANGATLVGASGLRLIQLVQGRASVTTVLHEMAHVIRPLLSDHDQAALLAWTGEATWTTAAEERFARGFEQYLGEGHKTGDEKIDGILEKMASWFKMIYEALFEDPAFVVDGKPVELTDEARARFQRILEGKRGPVELPGFGGPADFEVMFQDDVDRVEKLTSQEPFEIQEVSLPEDKSGDRKWMIEQVRAFSSRYPDGIKNTSDGKMLKFSVTGAKKSAQTNADRSASKVVPALPEILEKAVFLFPERHRDDPRTELRNYGIKVKIEGDAALVTFTTKPDAGGSVAHNVYVWWVDQKKVPSEDGTDQTVPVSPPDHKSGGTDSPYMNKIVRWVLGVKPEAVLFQDDTKTLETALAEKQKKLENFTSARDGHIAALSKGKTSDEKKALEAVVDEYLVNLGAQVAADRVALEQFQASARRPSARKEAIRAAVAAGKPIPDAWVQEYEAEPWARDELARRADLKDQLDMARQFDSLDDYLEAIVEDRVLQTMGEPFDSVMTAQEWEAAEAKARDDATIMPEDFERFKQVFAIAHAKTPEQLDKEFAEGLNPDQVKRILAGMNQGAFIADKNLPRHVTAQVTKSFEGGTVDEAQIPRILKTMKNDPRTYRRIAQQGFPDLAELEALAVEQEVEKATRNQAAEDAPPVIKPIEIPTDMTIEDKVAIRVGTKNRMEWMRKALDAGKELDSLDRVLDILERLSDKWTVRAGELEKPDYSSEDLTEIAELAKTSTAKLQAALRALVVDAGADGAKNADRTTQLISTIVRLVRSEMKTKEAARRAYRDQAEEMRKMGAYLAKPAPKTIHVEYARKIEQNRALIDPHFRTLKKSELLALEAEWYADHPDVPAPRARRGELYGKNLNLWTYEELYAAYLQRKALEEMGRGKMIARKLETENRRYLLTQKILDAVFSEEVDLRAKIQMAEDEGDAKKKARYAQKYLEWEMRKAENLRNLTDEKAAQFNRGGEAWFLTLSNLADSLDGMADFKGINHKTLWSDPNAAENAHLKETDRRKRAMFAWVKENKIDLGRLKDRVKVEGVEGSFSHDALLTVYVGDKNLLKRKALMHGNRISKEVFDHVNRSKDLQWLRDLGDQIIREYEENKNRLFDVAEEYENVDMRTRDQENYTPMMRTEINQEGLDQQLEWEQGMAMAVRTANIEHGFTEARIDVGDEHQKPIKMGEFTQWLEMVSKQEQYISFTPIVKDLKAVYLSSDVKDAITQTHGKRVWQEIDTYIKSLANRYHDKTFTPLDRVMQKLSQHAALAYMAYNLGTVMKQVSSLPLFVAHTRPDLLAVSLMKMANPVALVKKVDGLSIQMKTRVPYAELDDLRLAGGPPAAGKTALGTAIKAGLNQAEKVMVKVADPGMKPMQWVDKLVAAAGWDASYETAKAKGFTEMAAVEYADWVVGKTQQTTHVKDTAGVMRTNNSMIKAMTLFAGPGVKIYNELVYGTRANLKNGHHLKSFGTLLGIATSAIVFYGIGAGRPPEDEEWYEWVLLGMTNNIPIAGGALTSLLQGYDSGNILLNQAIESAVKAGEPLAVLLDKAASDEKKASAWPKTARAGLDLLGLGLGAPVSPVKRIWKAIETGDTGELVGWHAKE